MRFVLICLFAAIMSACSDGVRKDGLPSSTSNPSEPAIKTADAEKSFQDDRDSAQIRAEARQAALSFTRERLPKWEIKGVQCESYSANVYRVSVDLQNGTRKEILDLTVKRFFPETGEPYWRARILTDSVADALHESEDFKNLERLNSLETGEENYEPPDR